MASCTDETRQSKKNISGYTFSVRSLGTAALPRSLPLVLSEEIQYNPQTHTVVQVPSEQTGSKLVVVQSTLNLIRSLGTKPLAVLSICGPYRSGKSYFLSRFLGSDEVFKISNTDDPCTQGIWMSTSILECEEFAILLLDTEGMGSLEASEDYIVKLLVVTIISSSVLIYNSIGIPQRCDLENLSLLTNATSSIIVKSGAESDDLYQYFPNFLWLVRDASLTYAGSPTDYLKNEVLIRSAKVTPDKIDCIVQSIVSLFPSIECHMLPRPSVDPEILTDMLSNESQLDFEFIERLQDLNRYLCTRITPKGFDSQTTKTHFGGLVVAELIEHYVRAVNSDQDIVLQTCWHSAFQSALYSYSNQLIAKYQQQMKAALEGKLPLEQGDSSNTGTDSEHETLMEIHNRIASILYDDLCHEIEVLLGSTSSSDLATVIQNDFQNKIAVYDMLNSQVESGELLHFVNENYDESTKFCQSLFDQLHSNIHEVVTDAHRDKTQTDIYDDIETAKAKYYENAIGPAKDEILKLGKIKLQTVCDSLTDIPGPPAHLKATKIAKDEVMIRWSGASFNVDKVTKYTVECVEAKLADKSWNHVTVNNHECTATASGLKPHTRYLFRVYAYINDYKSCESTISVTTKVSTSARGAATFGAFIGGALITPVAATTINPVLAPAMTVVGLFGAPVVGGLCAKRVYKKCSEENIPYYPWRPQM